jgi:EpsI family protein
MKHRAHIRFWSLLVALLLGGIVINLWDRAGEAKIARQPLSAFPRQIGSWRQQGQDIRFDSETEKVLRADDYVSRSFEANGVIASLYVGYYLTQRTGATYHSPLNCLPGSGWVMSDGGKIMVAPTSGPSFEANRYLIQNGNQKALMIYWYQGRGSAVASEYWAKVYTVLDSVRRRRSDGALVRVMVPVIGSEQDAEKAALDLSSQAAVNLPAFVPN